MMAAREIVQLLDREATLTTAEGLRFQVTIVDARQAFGRLNVQVEPIAGEGTAWVSMDRVEVER